MRDEHAHMIATCAHCGFRFDILLGLDCPRCRREAVKMTFRPRSEAYDKLSFLRSKLAEQGVRWHGEEWTMYDWTQTEVPEGCKMPADDAAQIYELRRMFRL